MLKDAATLRAAWDKFMREAGAMHAGITGTDPHALLAAGRDDLVSDHDKNHIYGCDCCLGVVAYIKSAS